MDTYGINIEDGGGFRVTDEKLAQFAASFGLNSIAFGRYSKLVHTENGVLPMAGRRSCLIVEELKALEGQPNNAPLTKPATQFTNEPLRGLWHKHSESPRVLRRPLLLRECEP